MAYYGKTTGSDDGCGASDDSRGGAAQKST